MRWVWVLALAACAAPRAAEKPQVDPIRRGVDYLLGSQNADGSWGSAGQTTGFDVYAPVPGAHDGFRSATTALCVMALRNSARTDPRSAAAMERGLAFLVERGDVKRATPDALYNVWAHSYALQALAQAYSDRKDPALLEAAKKQLDALKRYETMYGGWNYYDFVYGARTPGSHPTSFGTAAGLVALAEARAAGIEVPQDMIERAVRMLRKCRKPDGSYLYDSGFRRSPLHFANRDKGSLGRSQAGNYALSLYGDEVGEKELAEGLDRFFREHKFLEIGRKRQFPHEAWYYTSGYYYYFGHYYAARILEGLRPADREQFARKMRETIEPLQEADGSWWDYNMYGYEKPYGTAYAVMILERTRE